LYVVTPVDSFILKVNPRFYKSRGHYISVLCISPVFISFLSHICKK